MTARTVRLDMVRTRPPFSTLFPIEPDIREAIAADMRVNGFDGNAPISVWPEPDGLTVVDGHTRLEAAAAAELSEIVIFAHNFADEDTAYDYAVRNQRDRRNLSGEAQYNLIMQTDAYHRRPRGGTGGNRYTKSRELSAESSLDSRGSAAKTAEAVGVSEAMVYRARVVAADAVALDALKSGKSLSAAAEVAYDRKRPKSSQPSPPRKSRHPATNGRTPPSHDAEPWFKARSVGSIAASKIALAMKDIQHELDRLKAQGIEIADHMDNRQVSREWSGQAKDGAMKRANELQRLIRRTIHGYDEPAAE